MCEDALFIDGAEGITYVIGHKNPDADAVGSAAAYAWLLRALGIEAEAVIPGPVNPETRYALAALGLAAPPVLTEAAGRRFVLVDHSAFSQALDGMKNACVAGVVDHHELGDAADPARIPVRSARVGATATLVLEACGEWGLTPPREPARYLLMSLLSDTRGMTYNVSAPDEAAFARLTSLAEVERPDALYQGMAAAGLSYDGMTEREIFHSDYKAYEAGGVSFGMAVVKAVGEGEVRAMADRMAAVMEEDLASLGVDMLFALIKNHGADRAEIGMYMAACGDGARGLLREALGVPDGGGYLVLPRDMSRKAEVVPALKRVLEKRGS